MYEKKRHCLGGAGEGLDVERVADMPARPKDRPALWCGSSGSSGRHFGGRLASTTTTPRTAHRSFIILCPNAARTVFLPTPAWI